MVNFRKHLATAAPEAPVNPVEIYQKLDRASDKGPLRPAQEAVLTEWDSSRRSQRDLILKLHTGEGKTLLGLLILQSKLNESRLRGEGHRALYLCPNNFLVGQTLLQARQFGVPCVETDSENELPAAFLDGSAILVATVQSLFNGRTRFGLDAASMRVDSIVLDDAHACIDVIKDACSIKLPATHQSYQDIVGLFGADLEQQGIGTFADIRAGAYSALLPVPYWAWYDRSADVAAMLAKHAATKEIKWAWPVLRDRLRDCLCIVTGTELVIAPYRPPIEIFGSYANATHRVLMSATISDDAFLVRGLGITADVVAGPLTHGAASWSGEKMVLLPSDIDDSLTSSEVVSMFGPPTTRTFGVVALVPSFLQTRDWATAGATVAKTETIDSLVEQLRLGDRGKALAIANRYDGIDLPDDTCRVLILDGKPLGDTLLDRYAESCRPTSDAVAIRTARAVEQGLGRAVRGEKDYCAIILSGKDLVRMVRTIDGRRFLSPQSKAQLEIGLQISRLAQEELVSNGGSKTPKQALSALVRQSLQRDDDWKTFYTEQMNARNMAGPPSHLLGVFAAELAAERKYEQSDPDGAINVIQALIDGLGKDWTAEERGWYLQEMARYQYPTSRAESLVKQAAAYRQNRYLLRPQGAVVVTRLQPVSQKRVERIIEWVRGHVDFPAMSAVVDDLLGALRFGTRAEAFERALHDLGAALGFVCERPDKAWKEGPDNLWALRDGEYLLMECKSEVELTRAEIGKYETGQMNNASAWFAREYVGASVTRVLIIPPRNIGNAAGFTDPVSILREKGLKKLARNVQGFFREFRTLDLKDLSEAKVQSLLQVHHLRVEDLLADYFEAPREP